MLSINKKIYSLFNKKEKVQYIGLRILSVVGSFLDMLSVSLILPLVYFIIDNKENSFFKKAITRIIPNMNNNQYLFAVVLLLVIIFILKNVFLSFEYYAQSKFTNKCKNRVKKQIYDSFLFRPYEQFIKYSSGEIISSVNENCEDVFIMIYRYLIMKTEITVSIVIFIYLFIIDYKMTTVIVLMLILEVAIIFVVIDPIIKKMSHISYNNSIKLRTWVNQTFNGIKEVKISSRIKDFSNIFKNYSEKESNAKTRYDFLSSLPRNIIEAVSVSCILLYILFFINASNNVNELIPHLSAFTVALVRLLPSFNRVSNAKSAISYYENKLDNIIEQLNTDTIAKEDKQNNCQITFNNCIEMKDICFKYSERNNVVIENGQLEIKYGSLVGIVGPSGAGKTTLVDILLGLLKPQKGVVLSDGKDINDCYQSWISNIGYIPQNIFIMNASIKKNIGFGLNEEDIDDNRVIEVLKQAQLFEFVKTLKDGIDTIIGESGIGLSGGQVQRIGIARALYNDPQLLIFDEATSSLDADTEREIMESINKLRHKKTIIVITHKMTIIQNSDIIYRIENKKIYREK